MKKLTQKQLNEIKSIEECGDNLLKKPTFNKCMDAVDKYIEAQDLLVKYAADDSALSSYGELKTEIIDYKVWHSSLVKKMNDAQKMLSDSKIIKKCS